ncbi:MAG: hypothetical protein KIT84_11370 [Labilithrix sp.]|nr:hypothetical protein [Labilithrix sp.]MCW5811609.1 hypothetical protein [Labilithrix sp.]
MSKKHLDGRQNPLAADAPDDDVERWLNRVHEHFGSGWLDATGTNTVQMLWKRRDMLATSELVSLGHALERLSGHPAWLRGQVRIAKGKDTNNAGGAIFEILALGNFDVTDAAVVPAKASQPGFDGTLVFKSGGRLILSLKRYGTSNHQAEFNRRAESLRRDVAGGLKQRGADGFALIAVAESYPGPAEWADLRKALDPNKVSTGDELRMDDWYVRAVPLPDRHDAPLAASCGSLTVQVIAPFHQNEADNLRSKLFDACANLARHGVQEGALSTNMVYVHVPSSASIADCATWVRQWFEDYQAKPVSAVLLYQPAVVRSPDNRSHIHHCFFIERRDESRPLIFGDPNAIPHLSLPVGTGGREPSIEQLAFSDGRVLSLRGRYAYQRGDVYREMVQVDGKNWSATLESPAPGVHEHAVIPKHFGGSGRAIVQPRFAPSDDLVLL